MALVDNRRVRPRRAMRPCGNRRVRICILHSAIFNLQSSICNLQFAIPFRRYPEIQLPYLSQRNILVSSNNTPHPGCRSYGTGNPLPVTRPLGHAPGMDPGPVAHRPSTGSRRSPRDARRSVLAAPTSCLFPGALPAPGRRPWEPAGAAGAFADGVRIPRAGRGGFKAPDT